MPHRLRAVRFGIFREKCSTYSYEMRWFYACSAHDSDCDQPCDVTILPEHVAECGFALLSSTVLTVKLYII